jgi:hypothetical protein
MAGDSNLRPRVGPTPYRGIPGASDRNWARSPPPAAARPVPSSFEGRRRQRYCLGVGTKRHPKPPPPAAQQPLDHHALNAALRLFVSTFVVDDKRSQIHKRLLTSERRQETLASLPRWIAVGTAPLEGADRSPAGLRARLGDMTGIRLTEDGASRTTIARALELDRGTSTVFIADSGQVAMITVVDGPPILCSRLTTSDSAARGKR